MATGAIKLARLRKFMETLQVTRMGSEIEGVQAVIVTSEDAHGSEYIRDRDERRRYISNFSGSLGTAIITKDHALLWTDGRYFVQATEELDPPESWTLMKMGIKETPTKSEWLSANLPPQSTVVADPHLLDYSTWVPLSSSLSAAGHCLVPCENLIDKIWDDRPPESLKNIVPHPFKFSGKLAKEKVDKCREEMKKKNCSVMVLSVLDDIAYLLNLRGSDIPYNPVFFSYVIVLLDEVHFFVDKSKVTEEAEKQLKDEGVDLVYHPYDEIIPFLKNVVKTMGDSEKVWISSRSNYALHSECKEGQTHIAITPVQLMKVIKNEVESKGMKAAHVRDAVALVKYFAWLEDSLKNDKFVTEVSGATKLEEFRGELENYVGLSFPTISSVGPHGAVIHYQPSEATDKQITDREIYLCDSGAQYLDGTTDVTRTLHFGEPTAYEKECFTRVFKGQTSLSTATFPPFIVGNYLDTLARKSLWDVGLNYLHGTGHGVGSYLNVHEYPVMISWKTYPEDPGVQPGIFISNEPGYYEDGKFGIRLENIEYIVKANTKYSFQRQEFLTFETVTLVPIQTKMLDVSLLTDLEINHLNRYHERCLKTLSPLLQGPNDVQALRWLEKETQPIAKHA